jgi:aspartyl/asparaginyl-tRNA synthetase
VASAKLVFLTLRKQFDCVHAVMAQTPEKKKQMVKWAAGLEAEIIVQVTGIISK